MIDIIFQIIQSKLVSLKICNYSIFFSDIFWFRDLAEVEELRDGEHYAITTTTTNLEHCEITDAAPGIKSWIKGRSVLEIYNTAASDAGQYLCIGVNDVGECHQAIKLNLIGKCFVCT